MLARGVDLLPAHLGRVGPPFQRHRHAGVEPVEVVEHVGVRSTGWREQGIEDDGLPIEAQEAPLGIQLGNGEAPVQSGADRAIPGQPRPVDQLTEETAPVPAVQQFDRGQVGDELRGGIHNLPETRGRGLDLVVKVDGLMGCAVSGKPCAAVVEPPGPAAIRGGGLLQSRIVTPDQIRLNVLQAFDKKCLAAPPRKCRDAIAVIGCVGGKGHRPPQQIEMEPAAGLDIGEQPGPAFQHRIERLARSAIERARGDAADA